MKNSLIVVNFNGRNRILEILRDIFHQVVFDYVSDYRGERAKFTIFCVGEPAEIGLLKSYCHTLARYDNDVLEYVA